MTPYAAAALADETARVRSAGEGTRNDTLHRASFSLGTMIGAGILSFDEAANVLADAGTAIGLRPREVVGIVRRGLLRGAKHPRSLPSSSGRPASPVKSWVSRTVPTEKRYPPRSEVEDLWSRARPVTYDAEAVAWLRGRALDPAAVELWDLTRVLPAGPLPGWASLGRWPWSRTGHRLLFPLFDHEGRLTSLRARSIRPGSEIKESAPSGFDVGGLILACPMARRILAGDAPDWWRPEFVITEGTPDFLTWSHRQPDAREDGPAVLGVFSGSWSPALAERIPTGTLVALRGHADPAGERYMNEIAESLTSRCTVFRRNANAKAS